MTLNELRVGSIVTHPLFETPTNVKAIAFNGLYIGTKDGLPLHIDDFKPVKITDEVLELLHFVKMKDTALGIGEFDWWETDDISLTHIHKGLYGIHGFTLIFLPGRNDSPPSEFTDITETFKLIRKYNREALLIQMMRDSERDGLYDIE